MPDPVSYEAALRASLSASTATRAQREQNRFQTFCHRLGLAEEDATSRVLFLTWLVDSEKRTGKQIDRLLTHLDEAAQLQGTSRWRQSPEVAAFLPGLYRENPLGPSGERADPLYRELVDLLVDAVMAPSADQLRDMAAVLLVHNTPLGQADLPRLQWRHVNVHRDRVTIVIPPRSKYSRKPTTGEVTVAACRGRLCVVSTLRRLREHGSRPHSRVFAPTRSSAPGRPNQRVAAAVRRLNAGEIDVPSLVQELGESAHQIRDRAILLLAYGAAMGAEETIELRQRDVTVRPEGLLLNIRGRPGLIGIPGNPGMDDDPVNAWESWAKTLTQQGRSNPDHPAFLRTWHRAVSGNAMDKNSLNLVVRSAVASADLPHGRYAFSSLRWGLIRTAFRADEPLHVVAQQVGMKSLRSIAKHHRREHIIRRSVAGQLGL